MIFCQSIQSTTCSHRFRDLLSQIAEEEDAVKQWTNASRLDPANPDRAQDKFLLAPLLPHKCGVPRGDGTPHLCGSEELGRAPILIRGITSPYYYQHRGPVKKAFWN
jgi:hypothetical protein